jgi:hypothetical protein
MYMAFVTYMITRLVTLTFTSIDNNLTENEEVVILALLYHLLEDNQNYHLNLLLHQHI